MHQPRPLRCNLRGAPKRRLPVARQRYNSGLVCCDHFANLDRSRIARRQNLAGWFVAFTGLTGSTGASYVRRAVDLGRGLPFTSAVAVIVCEAHAIPTVLRIVPIATRTLSVAVLIRTPTSVRTHQLRACVCLKPSSFTYETNSLSATLRPLGASRRRKNGPVCSIVDDPPAPSIQVLHPFPFQV